MSVEKNNYRAAIYLALASVPAGYVVTYGQLAQLAGLPNAARLVGTVLRDLPDNTELPWHRVINAQGKLSFPIDTDAYHHQAQRLTQEGVTLVKGKIDLKQHSYLR